MAVIINRFKVRRNGIVYGPGQPGGKIITGLSEVEEARLIAGSNGTIEKYVPFFVAEEEKQNENRHGKAEVELEKDAEKPAEDNEKDFLNVNIDDLIKPGGK